MTAALPWPPALAGTPAVAVIEQAITRQRLSHSLLLQGEDLGMLVGVAHAIADRLLNPAAAPSRFPVKEHPDYLDLRPKGKTRIIPIGKSGSPEPGTMRDFLPKLYVTPSIAPQKVAIIYEADRMNTESSNAFLKTLEEPPARTTLLLLTTRPYSLLPTIRSRVLNFRFPSTNTAVAVDGWSAWLEDYTAWLTRLSTGAPDKHVVADHVFTVYGLVARFIALLDLATGVIWKQQKEKLPPDLDEDEQVAIETGIANGLRSRLFAGIEQATRTFALSTLGAGNPEQSREAARSLVSAVEKLEHAAGLLRLNLNAAPALEDFLLSSLRIWSRRG